MRRLIMRGRRVGSRLIRDTAGKRGEERRKKKTKAHSGSSTAMRFLKQDAFM
jgi:hypothetical protein